jgi:hypothetical protein
MYLSSYTVKISWYKERFKGVLAVRQDDRCRTFRELAAFPPALETGATHKVYLDKGEAFCYKKHKRWESHSEDKGSE